MMQGYLIDETKISYDFKDILNNWSNLTMEDLDRIHSSIPRHIEYLNELGKVLSKERSRRHLPGLLNALQTRGAYFTPPLIRFLS